MHDPDVVVNPKVIYILDNSGYHNWTQDERRAVEAFLRDHDIDPADVPVANRSGSLIVRMLDGGALELDLWVYDRVDGHLVRCPTCPCCVRRKRLKCEVHSALPVVSTAWIYGVDTTEEAVQLTEGADWDRIAEWCGGHLVNIEQGDSGEYDTVLVIPTLEGNMRGVLDDWVIRGIKNEFYPCKPDIFDATYEAGAA